MCREYYYPEETRTITFGRRSDKGVVGRADDGRVVLVDNDRGTSVGLMETWECRLALD
ncbi:MAG: hypothetical protein IKG94_07375 [Candidatus Methanomethylophilaceae archaeon]|nr:hypothetical protein [Candidatus Methanomethylophilaceae archaeon]MBR6205202.1 hypothetical protein [Candidatus Methanomethylophilaceae archaeon]